MPGTEHRAQKENIVSILGEFSLLRRWTFTENTQIKCRITTGDWLPQKAQGAERASVGRLTQPRRWGMGLRSEGSVTSAEWGEESTVPGSGRAGPKTPRWDGTACFEGLTKPSVLGCKK